jgi:hypothetical protein
VHLAELLSEIYLDDGNTGHEVISTPAHLQAFETERRYRFVPSALKAILAALSPPAIQGAQSSGWTISFLTLSGWMHQKQQASSHVFTVDPSYLVSHAPAQRVAAPVFEATPALRY